MEKKLNVKQEEVNHNEPNNGKFTYEELNGICSQLYQENQKLVKELQKVTMNNMFRRLDYLFRVLENADKFNDGLFVTKCINEIKEVMTIPEESSEDTDTKEKEK